MSLRDIVKQQIIKRVIEDAQSKMGQKKYTVIVADDVTIKILHHCFRMHELNELDVGVVLNVKFPRERVKVSPIYFLSCNYESAKLMCADYSNPKETKYAAPVHVYFNSKVPDRIIKLIKEENVRKYMKTFCEIHNDFLVLEDRVFSLNGGYESFANLYINKDSKADEYDLRAKQLVGLCVSLEEAPAIRYSGGSRQAKSMAEMFNDQFNATKAALKEWKPNEHQSVLFIFDRKDDPLTPFLHSLAFQPMVHDLLYDDILENGSKIRGLFSDESKDQDVRDMPDETDLVWVQYRHEFIRDVGQRLPKQFEEWQAKNAVVKLKQKGGNNDVKTKDLISAARDMPQYQKLVKQYTTNINMANKLMQIFKNSGLYDIIQLEQDMATGIDIDGNKVDRTKMQQQFGELLNNASVDQQVKLRAFMMYVISQGGMKPETRKTFLKQSNFDTDAEDTILNLGCLSVQLNQKGSEKSGGCDNYWKQVVKTAKAATKGDSLTRFTSFLEWTLTEHLSGKLSEKDFPWISKPQTQKKQQPKSYRKHKKNQDNEDNNASSQASKSGPRYIVYFLGGVSHSEIKTCYEFSKNNEVDIFVGSTLIYSPQQYLQCFQKTGSHNEEEKGDE